MAMVSVSGLRHWKNWPRLFVAADLSAAANITLDDKIAHYLLRVMRRSVGNHIVLCNGRDGAWQCTIIATVRHQLIVCCDALLQAQQTEPDVRLFFAPLKRDHQDYLLQKATELGVSQLQPVLTDHVVAPMLNLDRGRAIIREAAEQSERLTLPLLHAPMKLGDVLRQDFTNLTMFAALEAGAALALPTALAKHPAPPAAFLIGPEGGFSAAEMLALQQHANIIPIHLGQRVLRADTAALAALACWQGWCGNGLA
jgi:16S rRNA (uracil1498-N3)-methyltransferase